MENIRDLQAQARTLERSGQHAAALELYGRILEEPVADRDGSVWARAARLQLTLGQEEQAAGSYASAAERCATAGLKNLALSYYQRALRIDESHPEVLLEFGRLAAVQGYGRDARHGFVEFADQAAAAGDTASAGQALRDYLGHFPDDGAVARRLAELTGEQPPVPVPPRATPPAAPPRSPAALPGLMPTSHEESEAPVSSEPAMSDGLQQRTQSASEEEEVGAPAVERLEGFEPTHASDSFGPAHRPAAAGEQEPASHTGPLSPETEFAEDEVDGEESEPLPLLGFDEQDAAPEASVARADDDLPLIDAAEAPASSRPTDRAAMLRSARQAAVAEPSSVSARRELVRLLQEDRDPSLEETLSDAEHYFADLGRATEALEFIEQLARLRPQETAIQQRRVERALRAGNRQALIDAYLALAGRFEADLDTPRAQDALRRVLELDPANEEARAALASSTAAASPPRDYVDLGELILAGAPEEVTRFQVAIGDPTGDEEGDFAEILDLFRKKVSESLDPKDAASHYDLGLAFKEMGLLDDAIVHLQSGLRGGASPLATLEVLGECFVAKGQLSLAARVFERATRLDGVGDSDLVGVLYGLARCQEELGELGEARGTFERVVAVDLSFRDAAGRLQYLQSLA